MRFLIFGFLLGFCSASTVQEREKAISEYCSDAGRTSITWCLAAAARYYCKRKRIRENCDCECNNPIARQGGEKSLIRQHYDDEHISQKSRRVRRCCDAIVRHDDPELGPERRAQCVELCKYSTTKQDAIPYRMFCIPYMKVWSYCAADTEDNRACCREYMPDYCAEYCYGRKPICDSQQYDGGLNLFAINRENFNCLDHLDAIEYCNLKNQPIRAKYDASIRFTANC